ncbi:MAG: hypothetical protein JXO22_08340 [Phycisphaerae bacterium]|nr:hypothetical protein [Phycisphaerae bacterium]
MRQRLIWLMIILGAAFYIFAFLIGDDTPAGEALHLTSIRTQMSTGASVLFTMAIGLGIINLGYVHGTNILKRRKNWLFSIVVFVTFGLVLTALLWQYNINAKRNALEGRTAAAVEKYEAAFALEGAVARDEALRALTDEERDLATQWYDYKTAYHFMPRTFYLDNMLSPLAATVMSLLGFYITYAAYRAFRIRSVEASVMMISAAIVILGSDAIGGLISEQLTWLFGGRRVVDLPLWAELDNGVANSGMQRGLWIGISIAFIAVNLRILLGLERGLIEVRRAGD